MKTNCMTPKAMEITMEQLECVAGGQPFEEAFADTALYRTKSVRLGGIEFY